MVEYHPAMRHYFNGETYRQEPHVIVISLCHVPWKMAPGVGGVLKVVTLVTDLSG